MAIALRLFSVAIHDLLKRLIMLSNFADCITCTHHNLINVTITHEISMFSQCIFKTSPNFRS